MPLLQQSTRRPGTAASTASFEAPATSAGELRDPLASSALSDDVSSAETAPIQMVRDPSSPSSGGPPGAPGGGRSRSGLPDGLKAGIESLSGLSMNDVAVHYNSSKPADLQAHAYAQGSDIHLAPGRGGDLPHEAWHVAQQKQGRVASTRQLKGVGVNDSGGLEHEADVMGQKALQVGAGGGGGAVRDAAAPTGVAQLRGENPHAKATDHEGWTTTAHHIVAHSQLDKAFGKLDGTRKAAVLKAAIPTTITKAMVDNLKCVIDDTVEARAELRSALVSGAPDTDEVGNIKLGDMRMSFFEWQGGNQFQGPNTSIRAEPGAKKDDMDYDGQYFNGMSKEQFEQLTAIGEALPKLKDPEVIEARLIAMLNLTKDLDVKDFDAGAWSEVTDPAELSELASNGQLNRKHIESYAYLRAPLSQMGEGKAFDKITPALGGAFLYEGLEIKTFQVKGTQGYIPVEESKGLVPKATESKKLSDVLEELGVTVVDSGKDMLITPDENVKVAAKNKFSVTGYPDQIPYQPEEGGKFKSNKAMIEKKLLVTTRPGLSLYDYVTGKGMPTSTFLPKALYDTLD